MAQTQRGVISYIRNIEFMPGSIFKKEANTAGQ